MRWRSALGSSSRFWTATTWPAFGANAASGPTRGPRTAASWSRTGCSPTPPTPTPCGRGSGRCGRGASLSWTRRTTQRPVMGAATGSSPSSHVRCVTCATASSTVCSCPPPPTTATRNSFSTLLELLDPHRFTRGVKVRGKKDLDAVMVRRLKEDIRAEVGGFPVRVVEPVVIDGLPEDAPELVLSRFAGRVPDPARPALRHRDPKWPGCGRPPRRGVAATPALVHRGFCHELGATPRDCKRALGEVDRNGKRREFPADNQEQRIPQDCGVRRRIRGRSGLGH